MVKITHLVSLAKFLSVHLCSSLVVMGLSLVAVRSLTCFSLNYNGNNSDGQFSGRLYKLMKDCCDCFGRYLFACLTDEANPVQN